MPPSAPPANISRTRSRLTTSPAANRPAAISQSNHGAMPEVSQTAAPSVARPRPLCVPNRSRAVVASLGARLPRRPVRGLGHRLAHRPHVLRRRPRRPGRRHRAPGQPACRAPTRPSRSAAALTALRGLGERRFRLVLPVPGDVRGLPAVPGLAAARPRVRAGRRRRAAGARARGRSAPRWSQWTAFPLDGAPPVAPAGRGHPARACPARSTSPSATPPAPSRGLDVARWNPEVPALLAGLGRTTPAPGLPDDHDPLARLRARPGPAAGRRPRPGDGRRAGGRGQPRPGRRPRRRAAAAGRRRPRGHDRRVQLGPAGALASLASAAMTEPMTMNRVIHAAVRRDLDRLSTGAGRGCRDGDRARARRAGAGVREPPRRAHPPPRGRGHLPLADAGRRSASTRPAGGDGVRARRACPRRWPRPAPR